MVRPANSLNIGLALSLAASLGACAKLKQSEPQDAARARAQAKRQQEACGSQVAYDRLKGLVFDRAIGSHSGDRANLDTLADYSTARMEEPVVKGFDPALDMTRCQGRFVLDIPAGAERGLGGERRLQADVQYTAQASADGNGLVYRVDGADPIVAKLAAFDLNGMAYRPPPAIDEAQSGPALPPRTVIASADRPPTPPIALPRPAPAPTAETSSARPPVAEQSPSPRRVTVANAISPPPTPRPRIAPQLVPERTAMASGAPTDTGDGAAGEDVVRSFYAALGDGNGAAASAHIVPEKRSSRAYSPDAISRFYGRLPEPLRLVGIAPAGNGSYRVRYGYSSGRSYCNGSAVVSVTNRDGRALIRSIRALSGC